MSFIDEVTIEVQAGQGGHGCLSFLREKSRPFGGPNGGNGGKGGDVILEADHSFNTLVDLYYQPLLRAKSGMSGMGSDRDGRSAEPLIVKVPAGTQVLLEETGELVGDLTEHGERFCVARGGDGGFGNAHFKTSTNRAPRKTTQGGPGEERRLILQLKLLADVGLLGMPNAGKSSLLRAVSAATPKVANYPFTTLRPYLGTVRVDTGLGFVMADVPGLIAGAADGVGLGVKFLKHLGRCRLLCHVVDMATEPDADILAASVEQLAEELFAYGEGLDQLPRWLILNKADLLSADEFEALKSELLERLQWQGPVYVISALKKEGTASLSEALSRHLLGQKDEAF